MRLFSTLTIVFFLAMFALPTLLPAEEFRVWGGKTDDFTDSKGRVWNGAQQENQSWGGWIELAPRTAEVKELTADAQAQAEAAGYDVDLFYAVSWAQFPALLSISLKPATAYLT